MDDIGDTSTQAQNDLYMNPTPFKPPSADEVLEYSVVFGDVMKAYYGPKKNPISPILPQRQSYLQAAMLEMTQGEKVMLAVGLLGVGVGLYQIFKG
jgi:hypothetical protein